MHRLGFTARPRRPVGSARSSSPWTTAFEAVLTRWAEANRGRPLPTGRFPGGVGPRRQVGPGQLRRPGAGRALLSLMAHESGLTLAQTAVPDGAEDKTNEHKTACGGSTAWT